MGRYEGLELRRWGEGRKKAEMGGGDSFRCPRWWGGKGGMGWSQTSRHGEDIQVEIKAVIPCMLCTLTPTPFSSFAEGLGMGMGRGGMGRW